MNALQEIELEEVNGREFEGFRITDASSLTWAFRKLAAFEAKRAEVNKLADDEVRRIEEYRKTELSSIENSELFFKGLITQYASERREQDPKFKSEKTPYGAVSFRKQQPKWHYDDEKLVSHLSQNGLTEFVRTKVEPVKTDIKKAFKVTDDGSVFDPNGQLVEGIIVEYQGEAVDVKVSP